MSERAVILLTRGEVASLLPLPECIEAVEQAFRLLGQGRVEPPSVLSVHAAGGAFHVKAGILPLSRDYFVAKVNANFPGNPASRGLPTIQGVLVLCDARDGRPLAVMDSIEITARRTAAATAVAARHLARQDAEVAAIFGCGEQGRAQLAALAAVRRLSRAYAIDADAPRAASFAAEMSQRLGFPVEAAVELRSAARQSDLIVTCTTSRRAFLGSEDVAPGAFVAGVGADNPEKQELDPALLASSKLVVDLLDQCAVMGDLHHALAAGALSREDVHAELAQVVAGGKPGRESADEVIVFDSTGLAIQDVAAAAAVYEKAEATGAGNRIDLSS